MSYERNRIAAISAAVGIALLGVACSEAPPRAEVAAVKMPDPARPADPIANLPSDSGSQTTPPSGAVTGAGQPQGTGVQLDVGAPGGVERKARAEERAAAAPAAATAAPVGAAPAAAGSGSGMSSEPIERPARPPKQSKG